MLRESLYIYTLDGSGNKTPFPTALSPAILSEWTYTAERMAGAPTITGTLMHRLCLDDVWSRKEFVEFNGERYYMTQVPTSSKDTEDVRYKHELTFTSERIVLENVFFFDVITANTDEQYKDRYRSNGTTFSFYGTLHELVSRLNDSLIYSGLYNPTTDEGYHIIIDDDISVTEEKEISLENVYFTTAMQEIYNQFGVAYYWVGKTCHVGYTDNSIATPFEYGQGKGLISITKTNADYRIINRITGTGSSDNIPYYYPNKSADRNDPVNGGVWITPTGALMPPIYRESHGGERFYNALNNTYSNPNGGYYSFNNPYTAGNPMEGITEFEDIKPSIKGMKNATGQLLGEIADIAYDSDDSDEVDNNGDYVHSYFYIKLHVFNGTYGFNLFKQATAEGGMTFNMTSGNCAGCAFEVGVSEPRLVDDHYEFDNPVQVDSNGNIKPGSYSDKVNFGNIIARQQDTSKYEVWVALKKDVDTFGIVMPNASNNYKPKVGDTFVITNILMPQVYITNAENELKAALIKHMSENNDEKFTFSISLSRIYLQQNPEIASMLDENARLIVRYNEHDYTLYVSSFSCKTSDDILGEITVEVTDEFSVGQSVLRDKITEVAKTIINEYQEQDVLGRMQKNFLSKRQNDTASGHITFNRGIDIKGETILHDNVEIEGGINASGLPVDIGGDLNVIGNISSEYNITVGKDLHISGSAEGNSWSIDKEGAAHFIELLVDALAEMGDARADTMGNRGDFRDGFFGEGWRIWQDPDSGEWCMTIDRLTVRGTMSVYELLVQKIRSVGGMIAVSAANGKVKSVEELTDHYRITFEEENQFVAGDLMRCQTFSGSALKSYWVEVASAESDGYSVLVPKSEFSGSLAEPGDECVLMGSTSNAKRRSLIAISATEDGYPRIEVLNGIKSKSFGGCLRAQLGNLDNIDDADFADLMPLGDGLYSDNAYLKGVFRLKDGRDVGDGLDTLSTSLTVMRGEFDSKIQGLRQDFIEERGFLSNPVFTYGLDHWRVDNSGIYTYMLAGKFFFVNGSILSYKESGTDIVDVEGRKCVRLRASKIIQPNGELREKPDIEDTDSEGRPVAPFVYLSVMYKCTVGGMLKYGFSDRDDIGFAPMNTLEGEADISPEGTWKQFQASGQWNGTGDFFLDFSGELLITTVVVTADKTQALIYRTETEIQQLSDRITLIAKNFDDEGNLTAVSELLTTAEFNLFTSSTFNEDGTLKNTSGLVTTSGFASLFSTAAAESGLTVTSGNFDEWFAESAESRGYIGSAQIATMITDGIGKAVITADQVYIRSGSRDESLDNYFFLDGSTGNVTMHDLYAHDITVEGVINNLVMHIKADSLGDVTCPPLTDADLVSYIRGEVSLESYSGAYRSLDVLRCPAVLSFEGSFTDINSLGRVCLALPYFYWYGVRSGTTVEDAGYAKNYLRTQTAYNVPAPLPFDGFLSSTPSSVGAYKDSDAPDKIFYLNNVNCFLALFGTEHYASWKNYEAYNNGATVNKEGAFVYDGQLYKWNETSQSLVAVSVNARLVNVEDLWQCVGKRITVFNRSQGELHLLLNEEFRLTEDDTGQRYYRVEEEEDCIREVIIAPSGYTELEFCSGFCAMSETARSGLPAFFWRLNTHTTDARYLIRDSDW